MRCDFIAKRSQSRGSNSSVDRNKDKEHPMSKYRLMTKEFEDKVDTYNEGLAKRYREEQIEQRRQRELNILRSPTQQYH